MSTQTPRVYDPRHAPTRWGRWLAADFGATPALSQTLWRLFRASATASDIRHVVRACRTEDPPSSSRLRQVVPPSRLLAWLRTLAPEGQADPRPHAVRTMEEAILARADGPQTWRDTRA